MELLDELLEGRRARLLLDLLLEGKSRGGGVIRMCGWGDREGVEG